MPLAPVVNSCSRGMLAAALIVSVLVAAPAAKADDGAGGGPAAELLREGLELYHKDDYRGAKERLDKALAADPENDEVRRTLAMIAFFYAEDAVAREHLSKLKARTDEDAKLEAILDTPFKKAYGDAAATMQCFSDSSVSRELPKRAHYHVSTDYGFDKAKWSSIKPDYDSLVAAAKKGKPGEKALEAFLARNRTPGVIEAARCLEDIHFEYSKIIKFEKDPKLVSRVFVFKERGDYLDFCKFLTGEDHKDTGGLNVGTWRLLLVSGHDVGKQYNNGFLWEETRHTLYHEAFHQFLNYWMNAPSWINEGLAEVFGDGASDCDPKTGKPTIPTLKYEPIGAEGMTNFQQITGALKPTALYPLYPLKEFVRIPQETYYAKDAPTEKEHLQRMEQNYAQGWAACYFLCTGYKGGTTCIFHYLKALKEKKTNEEAIAQAFPKLKSDADWDKLDKQFRQYMQGLYAQRPKK